MAEPDDLQALEKITNEVDNSQVKILISSHCLKAQAFLLDKLRKQAERQTEICKFIGSSNLKLETEIKIAEQEIKSLNIAVETIKLGNVELNKEHLLSKERKEEIFERTKIGKKKYENLWLSSKKRYESIPIVQKLIEAKNKNQALKASINSIINESKYMVNEIKIKKKDLEATDKARILELAQFFVRERINKLTQINDNDVKIKAVLNEIDMIEKEGSKTNCNASYNQPIHTDQKEAVETTKDSPPEDEWSNLSKNSGIDTLVLPKLHLQNNDLDIFSIRLDQINKVDSQHTTLLKRTISSTTSDLEENPHKIRKMEEKSNENYISSYFDISLNNSARNEEKKLCNKNYSEKKLIHILEDIKLDKDETYKIINKLEVNQFQATKYITSKDTKQYQNIPNTRDEINKTNIDQKSTSLDKHLAEETVEIKLSKTPKGDVVDPPSQFKDISQSSEQKKAVPLNIPIEKEMSTPIEEDMGISKETKSQEKMINVSTASDDSYTAIKDKMLKQRNLDLSPQFMYSKSTIMHKPQEDKVTSKFFKTQKGATLSDDRMDGVNNKNVNQEQILKCKDNRTKILENETNNMDDSNIVVSSPKRDNRSSEVPVAGFLFNHGAQGIPESLNLSVSTTGFEDNEDFPHFIDSSVLLSPTANVNAPTSHNNEVSSQEVPNFLAGFRKTTLSFFGSTTSAEPKPDAGEPQSSTFNFAFGKDDKKGRGGFFSMFN